MDTPVVVEFDDVEWPNGFDGPKSGNFTAGSRFFRFSSGEMMDDPEDIKAVAMSYMHDSFGECPVSIGSIKLIDGSSI